MSKHRYNGWCWWIHLTHFCRSAWLHTTYGTIYNIYAYSIGCARVRSLVRSIERERDALAFCSAIAYRAYEKYKPNYTQYTSVEWHRKHIMWLTPFTMEIMLPLPLPLRLLSFLFFCFLSNSLLILFVSLLLYVLCVCVILVFLSILMARIYTKNSLLLSRYMIIEWAQHRFHVLCYVRFRSVWPDENFPFLSERDRVGPIWWWRWWTEYNTLHQTDRLWCVCVCVCCLCVRQTLDTLLLERHNYSEQQIDHDYLGWLLPCQVLYIICALLCKRMLGTSHKWTDLERQSEWASNQAREGDSEAKKRKKKYQKAWINGDFIRR